MQIIRKFNMMKLKTMLISKPWYDLCREDYETILNMAVMPDNITEEHLENIARFIFKSARLKRITFSESEVITALCNELLSLCDEHIRIG